MNGDDPHFEDLEQERSEPPISRLGWHTIGLWMAAEDIGDPKLLAALRPLVMHIGRIIAVDVMSKVRPHDTEH